MEQEYSVRNNHGKLIPMTVLQLQEAYVTGEINAHTYLQTNTDPEAVQLKDLSPLMARMPHLAQKQNIKALNKTRTAHPVKKPLPRVCPRPPKAPVRCPHERVATVPAVQRVVPLRADAPADFRATLPGSRARLHEIGQ